MALSKDAVKFWQVGSTPYDLNLELAVDRTLSAWPITWLEFSAELRTPSPGDGPTASPPVHRSVLHLVEQPVPYSLSNREIVSFNYEALKVFPDAVDHNKLMLVFGLNESESTLLQNARLSLDVEAKSYNFSPALALDPVLGKKGHFAEAFPNLDKLPDIYQKQNFRSLGTSLEEAVIEQPKGELEVFGAKVSSNMIARFGLPALAILLFQFSAIGLYTSSNGVGACHRVTEPPPVFDDQLGDQLGRSASLSIPWLFHRFSLFLRKNSSSAKPEFESQNGQHPVIR